MNLGVYARYRMAERWSASINADFKHYSNGTLDRPNLGVNTIGPTIGISYDLKEQPLRHDPEEPFAMDFKPRFYVDAVVGLGMKALIDGFNVYHSSHNPIYGFFTTMVAPMYRYHLLHASGIGIDYSYGDYVYHIRDLDEITYRLQEKYSPHILGMSLRHEVFYRHASLNVGLGYYLLKQTGCTAITNESRTYQHVSLRYSLPFTSDRLFAGYNIKAHRFSKVDCVQLMLGYRI